MNFLKYRNAREFLTVNELTVEQGLRIVEEELEKLKHQYKELRI